MALDANAPGNLCVEYLPQAVAGRSASLSMPCVTSGGSSSQHSCLFIIDEVCAEPRAASPPYNAPW